MMTPKSVCERINQIMGNVPSLPADRKLMRSELNRARAKIRNDLFCYDSAKIAAALDSLAVDTMTYRNVRDNADLDAAIVAEMVASGEAMEREIEAELTA